MKDMETALSRGRYGMTGSEGDEGLEKRWSAKIMQDGDKGSVVV